MPASLCNTDLRSLSKDRGREKLLRSDSNEEYVTAIEMQDPSPGISADDVRLGEAASSH